MKHASRTPGMEEYFRPPTQFQVGHRRSYTFTAKLSRVITLRSVFNDDDGFGETMAMDALPDNIKAAMKKAKDKQEADMKEYGQEPEMPKPPQQPPLRRS